MKARNSTKKMEKCLSISSNYVPLAQKKDKDLRGKKIVQQGEIVDKDKFNVDAEKDTPILDEDLLN